MKAERLLDGVNQHCLHKHPDVCILGDVQQALFSIISARNRLRKIFGRRQWTLTTGPMTGGMKNILGHRHSKTWDVTTKRRFKCAQGAVKT